MKKTYYILFILLLYLQTAQAQLGRLDSIYGNNGYARVLGNNVVSYTPQYAGMCLQPDGKALFATYFNTETLMRLNTNGTLDGSFGSGGKVSFHYGGSNTMNTLSSVIIQADGKILVAGTYDSIDQFVSYPYVYLIRFNANGSVDNSFGNNGTKTSSVKGYLKDMIQSNNGRLIALLSNDGFEVVCFDKDGVVDNSFGNNGYVKLPAFCTHCTSYLPRRLLQDVKGRIILSGDVIDTSISRNSMFAIARLQQSGSIDSSFGNNGIIIAMSDTTTYYVTNAMALQDTASIIIGGIVSTKKKSSAGNHLDFAIAKIAGKGIVDSSFGLNGFVTLDIDELERDDNCVSVITQPDNKIVTIGSAYTSGSLYTPKEIAIVRLNQNGLLDSTFGKYGKITHKPGWYTHTMAGVMQTDGKILAAGLCSNCYPDSSSDIPVLARILTGLKLGIVEFSNEIKKPLVYPNPVHTEINIEYELLNDENISISLININGQIVERFILNELRKKGVNKESLVISKDVPIGSYLLRIDNGKHNNIIRLTKE